MNLKRLKEGEPITSISASTWNALCDVAEAYYREKIRTRPGVEPLPRQSGIIQVRNESGATLPQFAVVELTDSVFQPSTLTSGGATAVALRERLVTAFKQQPLLSADTPDGDNVTKFGVLLQTLRDDAIGLAVVSGISHVRVSMQSEEHEFARVVDGESGYMESAASGPAKLLYVQPESERDPGDADNLAWCVVMLGGGGGGSEYFPVKVKKDGGAAGDAADPCSWTYSVYTIDAPTLTSDYLLDTGLTPKLARTAIGPYQYAPDGSEGMCRYQNGDIVLCVAWGEVPEVVECAT